MLSRFWLSLKTTMYVSSVLVPLVAPGRGVLALARSEPETIARHKMAINNVRFLIAYSSRDYK